MARTLIDVPMQFGDVWKLLNLKVTDGKISQSEWAGSKTFRGLAYSFRENMYRSDQEIIVPEPNVIFDGSDVQIRVHSGVLVIQSEFFMQLIKVYSSKAGRLAGHININVNLSPNSLVFLVKYLYSDPENVDPEKEKGFEYELRKAGRAVLMQLLDLSFCIGMFHLHDLCDTVLAVHFSNLDVLDTTSVLGFTMDENSTIFLDKWFDAKNVSTGEQCNQFFPDLAVEEFGPAFSGIFRCVDFRYFSPKLRALYAGHMSFKNLWSVQPSSTGKKKGIKSNSISIVTIEPETLYLPFEDENQNDLLRILNDCRIRIEFQKQEGKAPTEIKKIKVKVLGNDRRKQFTVNCTLLEENVNEISPAAQNQVCVQSLPNL